MRVSEPQRSSSSDEQVTLRFHLRHEREDVVTHEVELVRVVFVQGMNSELRLRQREDEPAVTYVDGVEAQDVAKERPVRFGVLA